MPVKSILETNVARIIAPEWFDGPDDQSSPTELEMFEVHSPRYQDEARRKARDILALVLEQR